MLGDHDMWRKSYAYEGSARVPMVMQFARSMDYDAGREIDRPVGLEDLMPTILEAAGVDVPSSVDGRSMLDLLADDDRDDWRDYYHGEHGPTYHRLNGNQFLVDEDTKYVWHPMTGRELLFDLEADPYESTDLASENPDELERWRDRVVDRLSGRPEGFTDGESLQTIESTDP